MSAAAVLRNRILTAPTGTFFHVSREARGAPFSAVATEFSRLSKKGEVLRVRKGLYWKGIRTRRGILPPDPVALALEIAGPGSGPAGWDATHALRVSTQIPFVHHLAILGPPPTGLHANVVFHVRRNDARRGLRLLEVGLVEVLRTFPEYAETDLHGVALEVRRLAARGELDLAKIGFAVETEPSVTARRTWVRLRDALARLGADSHDSIVDD